MQKKVELDVGQRLRYLRQRQRLTQRALANACNMSANAVGLIERGECSPSISTLHRLAVALGVPITDLFTEPKEEQAVVLVQKRHRSQVQRDGVVMESLAGGLTEQGIEPFLVTLEPTAGAGTEPVAHLGDEFVFCLEGQLEYRIAGQVYNLEAGDSLSFLAQQPHCWCNRSGQPTRFLLVFQAVGEPEKWWQQHLNR